MGNAPRMYDTETPRHGEITSLQSAITESPRLKVTASPIHRVAVSILEES
jgi:hypothetical protein